MILFKTINIKKPFATRGRDLYQTLKKTISLYFSYDNDDNDENIIPILFLNYYCGNFRRQILKDLIH